MSEWKKISNPEDPGWEEYHRDIATPSFGVACIRVWLSGSGHWCTVLIDSKGGRHRRQLDASYVDDAKLEADCLWSE